MASSPPRLGRIKGFAFAEFMIWYGEHHSRDTVTSALEAAAPRYGADFDLERHGFGILASGWYDAALVHGVLDRIAARHAPAELDTMASDAAENIMGKMLHGIYRTAFAFCVSPERYVRHVDKIWRLQYDNGTPVVIVPRATEHSISYRDWRSHHPLICRLNMASAKPIYSAMGCKGTTYTRVSCISDGGPRCQSIVTWR